MQNLGVTLAKPVLVFEWTLGAKYNHPEKNCCACGKASVSQSGTSGPTNEALWNSIQVLPTYKACAAAVIKTLVATCPGGVHTVHLRVTDRRPYPLFDCKRGPVVLGKALEAASSRDGRCLDASTMQPVSMAEVLLSDPGPIPLNSTTCVYVATEAPMHADVKSFSDTIAQRSGARVVMYGDVIGAVSSNCRALPASILEQRIVAHVPGRYVATFPSSWDEWSLHMRAQLSMPDAEEELSLFKRKVQRMLVVDKLSFTQEAKCISL